MNLKENYVIAKCCRPSPDDSIIGYYSHNNVIKVHRRGCSNLSGVDIDRIMRLDWDEITEPPPTIPDADYRDLDDLDFQILVHHDTMGVDYSLKVASILCLDKQLTFDRHAKLRDMKLLERVDPRIIRYRKNIVKGKWIKHRNHTYYDLTDKGRLYVRHYRDAQKG
jgi:hypothetical protein